MKVKVHNLDGREMYLDTTKARLIYRNRDSTHTIIEFGPNNDELYVKETIQQISSQLPGGIHEH